MRTGKSRSAHRRILRQIGVGAFVIDVGRDGSWQRILNERGWAAFNWPKEYGGPGWTPVQRMIFLEENQLAPAPVTASQVGTEKRHLVEQRNGAQVVAVAAS